MAQSIDVDDSSSSAAPGPPPANGHAESTASNGHASGAGSARTDAMDYEGGVEFKPLWEGSQVDRREFVRLALQAFQEIGYSGTAEALQAESGFSLEASVVTEFRSGVLAGKWDVVERLLLELPEDDITDFTTIKFVLRQQKFLEALEAKETKKALSILRNELAPLNHNSDRLHLLSSLIMCGSPEDLRSRAGWDGVAGRSREQLLDDLQQYISPALMLPQRRLAALLEQAKSFQRQNCVFHSADAQLSLLADCRCDSNSFPSLTTHTLTGHTDEIWRLEFSHNGEWLATAGRDKTAIMWNVKNNFSLEKVFRDHADPVSCLAWSPDDSILLTAAESTLKMWNTETGLLINTLTQHEYPVGALSWLPDGKGFVSGGMDHRVYFWDLAGNVSTSLDKSPSRVIDLAVTPDGKRLVTVGRADSGSSLTAGASRAGSVAGSRGATPAPTPPVLARHDKRISVFSMVDMKLEYEIVQPGELTSVSISKDSRFAIVSHAPNEILYIDLRDGTILRRYQGHDQGQYVLQSCFGGALENYVLSGSEDGQIYVWHRDTAALVLVLPGHGPGAINAVAWNPKHSGMFASASDDRTVRIWGLPQRGSEKKEGKRVAFS